MKTDSWRACTWGDLATLEYGKALRGYSGAIGDVRVFGTNGAIGWHDEPLFRSGVVVGRKGAYRGIHFADRPCWVIDTAFFLNILDEEEVDPRFAYYQLRTINLDSIDSGSAIPSTNRPAFYAIPVGVPPLAVQRRIVYVLSAYDDLIEANLRRIELLEEMAQTIYREWFVDGRFPGSADEANASDPAVAPGWSLKVLGEVVTVDKGLSYKGAHLSDEGTPMANLKCFRPSGGFRRDGTKPYSGEFKSRHAVRPGDVIVANTDLTQAGNVVGSPAVVPRRGFEQGGLISHHVFAVRPCTPDLPASYLFHLLADERFRAHARGTASGTTVLGFRAADLLSYRFPMPPGSLIRSFAKALDPMMALAERLEDQNETLRTSRDLLLPRLISGEIDVSNLDIDATPLVA